MPNTSKINLPYPALTGANNPPADIQALAEAIDSYLDAEKPRRGTWTGSPTSGNTDRPVMFSAPFAAGVTPRVTLGLRDTNLDWDPSITALNVTNTGFTLRIKHTYTSGALPVAVDYIAIRP